VVGLSWYLPTPKLVKLEGVFDSIEEEVSQITIHYSLTANGTPGYFKLWDHKSSDSNAWFTIKEYTSATSKTATARIID